MTIDDITRYTDFYYAIYRWKKYLIFLKLNKF